MHSQPWEDREFGIGICSLVYQRTSIPSSLGFVLYLQTCDLAGFSKHLCGPFINSMCSISQDTGGATSCLRGQWQRPRRWDLSWPCRKESISIERRGGTWARGENTSVCRWPPLWEPSLPPHPSTQLRFCASQHPRPTSLRALTGTLPRFTHFSPDLPVLWGQRHIVCTIDSQRMMEEGVLKVLIQMLGEARPYLSGMRGHVGPNRNLHTLGFLKVTLSELEA